MNRAWNRNKLSNKLALVLIFMLFIFFFCRLCSKANLSILYPRQESKLISLWINCPGNVMNSHVYSCHLEDVLSFVSYTLTAKTNSDSYEDMSLYCKLSFVGLKKNNGNTSVQTCTSIWKIIHWKESKFFAWKTISHQNVGRIFVSTDTAFEIWQYFHYNL